MFLTNPVGYAGNFVVSALLPSRDQMLASIVVTYSAGGQRYAAWTLVGSSCQ